MLVELCLKAPSGQQDSDTPTDSAPTGRALSYGNPLLPFLAARKRCLPGISVPWDVLLRSPVTFLGKNLFSEVA